jgi:coenzyme F420-0:L-glutamate ligase/coenzyme F420-1:gamma-L-glutamate ligase
MPLTNPTTIRLFPLSGLPEINPGDDLDKIIVAALDRAGISPKNGDILVVAHKVVSKAEGQQANLADIEPGERALEIASLTQKDPRLVELILRESTAVSRMRRGVLITRHRLGFTSANAGIDRSNVPQSVPGEWVLLLPENPDRSAGELRRKLEKALGVQIGVIIADSHGRPFRLGTVGVAIGIAGLPALWDRRGDVDLFGYTLQHTEVGTADEIASAAGLLMGQAAEGIPVVLIRGLRLPPIEGKATDLVRPVELDLYR